MEARNWTPSFGDDSSAHFFLVSGALSFKLRVWEVRSIDSGDLGV